MFVEYKRMNESLPNNIIRTFRICPNCNYFCNTNELDEFCSLCGTKLLSSCKFCQTEISNPYAKFCRKCGKPYRQITSEISRSNTVHKRI